MKDCTSVPFFLCRPGTRLEFKVGGAESTQGVVKALSVYGARNYLVLLSEYVDREGAVHGAFDPVTKSDRRINLSHATRVLEHGQGPLVFENGSQYGHLEMRKELADWRAAGVIRRRGRRLVIDGKVAYAPSVVRSVVVSYLANNGSALGVLPWDQLDGEKVLADLTRVGVCQYQHAALSSRCRELFPVAAQLDTERLKRHLRRNINRYKLDLRAEEKARDAEDERYYREEMERESQDARRFFGSGADTDDDDIDGDNPGSYGDQRQDVFAD